jgi:hypothetical protein
MSKCKEISGTLDKQHCQVCRRLTTDDVVVLYPCYHAYHTDCLKDEKTCKLCGEMIYRLIRVGKTNLKWQDENEKEKKEEHKNVIRYRYASQFLSKGIFDYLRQKLTDHYLQTFEKKRVAEDQYAIVRVQSSNSDANEIDRRLFLHKSWLWSDFVQLLTLEVKYRHTKSGVSWSEVIRPEVSIEWEDLSQFVSEESFKILLMPFSFTKI